MARLVAPGNKVKITVSAPNEKALSFGRLESSPFYAAQNLFGHHGVLFMYF